MRYFFHLKGPFSNMRAFKQTPKELEMMHVLRLSNQNGPKVVSL